MSNDSTKAFRKMMLNGRMNQLMTEAVEEGTAATEAARSVQKKGSTVTAKRGAGANSVAIDATHKEPVQLRRFMRPIYFTPKGRKLRQQQTEFELDEEFRIPGCVLKGEQKPKD